MLKSVIQWKNYNRFILTKSCIAPLIEYGYYNLDDPDTKVCLFIDSGDSHTTFTIAEISGVTKFPSTHLIAIHSDSVSLCSTRYKWSYCYSGVVTVRLWRSLFIHGS